ncbi:SIMPL domain-containing protein [Alicyclobacillus tolerans]|uniref:SIMPL domain-containing protein n=1 Tax=Alicyclobacillus tolerans TaxID=90970 RepID=UPI001F1ABCD4|nr:SIMPL domain-containing protein [Alicyclobacillus tolerans]MCF8565665.1 SIMPL domain-containing protein [Alicyclobacillus tolerans]
MKELWVKKGLFAKKPLWMTAIALVIAGGAGTYFGWNGHRSVNAATTGASSAATITVVGHASDEVAPDVATIDAGVTTSAGDAAAAQQKNDQLMKQVIDSLNQAGVKSSDIHTTWYNIHPNYGPASKTGQPSVNGFQANDNIQIRVTNLQAVGSIVDTLVKAGANQINGVNYQVSNPLTIENQLYAQALADAKAQAANIAKNLGVDITGVQAVDTTNQTPGPISFGAATAAQSSAPISPNAQDISVNVKVVYSIASPS